jgi:uncharacterized membrane protein
MIYMLTVLSWLVAAAFCLFPCGIGFMAVILNNRTEAQRHSNFVMLLLAIYLLAFFAIYGRHWL